MITVHVESFEERLAELQAILPEHNRELWLYPAHVSLNPQFDVYIKREKAGELLFVTLRDTGELVGYFIGFILFGLHYSTVLTCHQDIFFVRKDKRKGSAGIRLFRFVEQELKRRGVRCWFMGSRAYADASALFKRIGASPLETYYSKWLGN